MHRFMNKLRSHVIASCALLVFWPGAVMGWGSMGHSIVAELAERQLPEEKRSLLRALLDGRSLASVSSLPDTWAGKDATQRNWHYVNIPYGSSGYSRYRDCPGETRTDCLPEKLTEMLNVLADRAEEVEVRKTALIYVVHLIADAHQPFHCIHRDNDRGAMDLVVTDNGNAIPLHLWWDVASVEKNGYDWGAEVDRLEPEMLNDSSSAKTSRSEVKAWVNDCFELGQSFAYEVPVNGALDEAYKVRAFALADMQLLLAAKRLANILFDVL